MNEEEKINYFKQRFNSANALAAFMLRSALRSSNCALYEYLHGTDQANLYFGIQCPKAVKTGDTISRIEEYSKQLPKIKYSQFIPNEHRWILDEEKYRDECLKEVLIYKQISDRTKQLSGNREKKKAETLIEKANQYGKILAFDSTIITLEYLKVLLEKGDKSINTIVATGQNERNKSL